MRNLVGFILVIAMAVFLFAGNASALYIKLDDTLGTSSTIVDQGAGDQNPVLGAVTFIGAVGAWTVNVTTGISKPVIPNTSLSAGMDMNSVNVSSPTGGKLVITLFDSGFVLDPTYPQWQETMAIGGTTVGTVLYEKILFDRRGGVIFSNSLGPFIGPAFSGTLIDSFTGLMYAMEMDVTITQRGAGTTSFDAGNEVVVPEPATMLLLGSGLLGLAGFARRRFRK